VVGWIKWGLHNNARLLLVLGLDCTIAKGEGWAAPDNECRYLGVRGVRGQGMVGSGPPRDLNTWPMPAPRQGFVLPLSTPGVLRVLAHRLWPVLGALPVAGPSPICVTSGLGSAAEVTLAFQLYLQLPDTAVPSGDSRTQEDPTGQGQPGC
jgi:hypothetical protein